MMEKVSGFIIVWKLRFHTIINAPRLGARMCQGTFFFIIQKRRNRLKSACAFVLRS